MNKANCIFIFLKATSVPCTIINLGDRTCSIFFIYFHFRTTWVKFQGFSAHSNFPFLWLKYENSFWQYWLISFLYFGQRKWALDMQKSSMWMYLKLNFCTWNSGLSCIKWNKLFVVLLGTIFRTIWLKFDGKGFFSS